ncbi:hypothetical protein AOQ84DRAFT_322110 [Glonium stellatum]|uniref:Helicase ATP-binding domain-containing protein n=1 Tax=Glonium stellatum TaxID=574774 RepID=A0A8E2EW56_9PEZI|nr:hypothetical protein AOQ84DRAFT_322110 [Glonium stellatum]
MLDLITAGYLHSLRTYSELIFTAVLASSSLNTVLRKPTHGKGIVSTSINIIGPERIADDVGNTLADASAYLQHPFFLHARIKYINPQYFYSENEKKDLRHLIGPPMASPRFLRLSEGVESLLESLDDLSRLAPSPDRPFVSAAIGEGLILTTLKRFGLPVAVKHQEDGVKFILNREDPAFCDSVTSDLKALISCRSSFHHPELFLGGIVADVMGLGKTLTMLSAVVYSKDAAMEFVKANSYQAKPQLTRATLIVVTSLLSLPQQYHRINCNDMSCCRHLKPGTLRVALFHGDTRAKTTEALIDYDIVLTTYRTLAFDWKGHRILQKIGWFRVVLDEAHWIRNQSSEQFKAAEGLQAERRWCLTGTPIQNSLDDLRSLLRFLQFQPFAKQAFFEEHIVEPLRSDSHDSFRNLKLLLRTICLRRNADYLHLPPKETKEVFITLTPEEREVYDRILKGCQAEFDRIVSTKSETKKYNVLFTTIMMLRRLCNHGTLQVAPPSWLFCEVCGGEDENIVTLLGSLETSPECSRCLVRQEC